VTKVLSEQHTYWFQSPLPDLVTRMLDLAMLPNGGLGLGPLSHCTNDDHQACFVPISPWLLSDISSGSDGLCMRLRWLPDALME